MINNGNNALLLAVSTTADPKSLTGADWNFFKLPTTESGVALQDYPGDVGYNADALVITQNSFDASGNALHTLVNSISMAALTSGTPLSLGVNAFQKDFSGFSLRPAAMQDSHPGDPMWFIQEGGDNASINVVKMTGVLTSNPVFSTTNLSVTPYSQAVPILQPNGSAITTETDSRIINASMMNGKLVAAHAVSNADGNLDKIQWYEIDASSGTPALVQQGEVNGGPGAYYAYPAIAINAQGDIGMTYAASGTAPAAYLSTYITGWRHTDAAGTGPSGTTNMEPPVLVQAGQANSIDGREGDMSGINVDSDGSFWIANEYATPALWGTVVAHFTLPLPQATNGTFGESDQVGTLGTPTTQATQFFNGNLQPQQIDPNLVFPGGLLDPGNRNSPLPEENHSVSTTPGGATIVTYSFPDVYGNDPTTGQPLHNQITANEEQTVRELFKLYSYYTGLTFIEKPGNSGDDWIVVGDPRVLNPAVIANTVDGISTGSLHDYYFGGRIVGLSVINGNIDWGSALLGQSTASGNYFSGVAMHGIGLNLGLEYNNDGPPGTIMGDGVNIIGASNGLVPAETFPALNDITNALFGYETNSNQIDLYQFNVDASGTLSAETLAQRLGAAAGNSVGSTLNTLLTLYEQFTQLSLPSSGASVANGHTFTITDDSSNTVTFEFTNDKNLIDASTGKLSNGHFGVLFSSSSTQQDLAVSIVSAVVNAAREAGLNAAATLGAGNVQLAGPITVNTSGAPEISPSATRQVIARNDDYFGKDSFINTSLSPGIYYVAVTSTGNDQFNPTVADSGWGGRTFGRYQLKLGFQPDAAQTLTDPGQSLFVPSGGASGFPTSGQNGYPYSITVTDNAASTGQPSLTSLTANTSSGALAAGTYYYVVTAVDKSGHETIASNEMSSALGASGMLSLSWTAGGLGANLAHYNVYRGTAQGGETLLAAVPAGHTSFVDDGHFTRPTLSAATAMGAGQLPAGAYYYVVTAVDANGDQTLASNEVNVTVGANGSVQLSWNASSVTGLTGYRVYRGQAAGAERVLVATVAGTGYTDGLSSNQILSAGQPTLGLITPSAGGNLAPGAYFYVVTAVDANGNQTIVSNEQSASTTALNGTLTLHWQGGALAGIDHYNVYRGTAPGGEALLTSVSSGATRFVDNGTVPLIGTLPPTSAVPPVSIASPGTSTLRTETIIFYNGSTAPNPTRGHIPVQLSPGDNQEQVVQKLIAALQAAVADGGFQRANFTLSDLGDGRIEIGGGTAKIVVDPSGQGALTGTPLVLWGDTQKDSLVSDAASGRAGAYNFWFNVGPTVYVDKSASPSGAKGTAAHPYTSIQAALAQPTLNQIVAVNSGSLAANTTYYYVVTAVDNNGGETLASNEQSASTTGTKLSLSLSWSPSTLAGLVNYRVYRATASGAETLLVTLPAGVTSLLDNGSSIPGSAVPTAGFLPAGQELNLRVVGNANATLAVSRSQSGTNKIVAGDMFKVTAGTFSGTFEFTTLALNPVDANGNPTTPGAQLLDGHFAVLPNFSLPTTGGALAQNIVLSVQAALNAAVLSLPNGGTATLAGNDVEVATAQTQPTSTTTTTTITTSDCIRARIRSRSTTRTSPRRRRSTRS